MIDRLAPECFEAILKRIWRSAKGVSVKGPLSPLLLRAVASVIVEWEQAATDGAEEARSMAYEKGLRLADMCDGPQARWDTVPRTQWLRPLQSLEPYRNPQISVDLAAEIVSRRGFLVRLVDGGGGWLPSPEIDEALASSDVTQAKVPPDATITPETCLLGADRVDPHELVDHVGVYRAEATNQGPERRIRRGKLPRKRLVRRTSRVVQQKEVVLLRNSHIIQDPTWVWLKELVEQHPVIRADVIKELPPEQQRFIRNYWPELVRQASAEWIRDSRTDPKDHGPLRETWVRCTLCGTLNRYTFYIVNRHNGKRMSVGSECVRHFDIDMGESYNQLLRKASQLRRAALLDNHLPGIKQIVEDWSSYLEQPILVPLAIEEPYRELGVQVRKLFEQYVDAQDDDIRDAQLVGALKDTLAKRAELIGEIEAYVARNQDRPYAVRREIVRWLEHNRPADYREALQWLKEDGEITPRTAHRIAEPGFINSIAPKIDQVLRGVGLRLVHVDERGAYILQTMFEPPVRLVARHRELLMECGEAVFGQRVGFGLEDILRISQVADTESREIVRGELASILSQHGLRVVDLSEILFQQNSRAPNRADEQANAIASVIPEWPLLEVASSRYILVPDADKIVEDYKGLVFKVGTRTVDQLVQAVAGPRVHRYTLEELENLYSIRKSYKYAPRYR